MRKLGPLFMLVVLAGLLAGPAFAQAGAEEAAAVEEAGRGMLAAALAIGLTGSLATLGMGVAIAAACIAMSRNPGATGAVRLTLIIGLAFIESVAIYALLIAFFGVGLF